MVRLQWQNRSMVPDLGSSRGESTTSKIVFSYLVSFLCLFLFYLLFTAVVLMMYVLCKHFLSRLS